MIIIFVSIYFGSPRFGHTIKANCNNKFLLIQRLLNLDFFEKDLELVSPLRSVYNYNFLRKIFFMLFYYPVDTERKLNVHKKFKRRPGRLLNVLFDQFTACVYGVTDQISLFDCVYFLRYWTIYVM